MTVAAVLVVISLSAAAVTPALAGDQLTWTYPSIHCPSDATHDLQSCIDERAIAGDTVEVAVDTVNEAVLFSKDLTLRGAPGFTPTIFSVFVYDDGSHVTALLEKLTVARDIGASFGDAGGDLSVRNVTVDQATDHLSHGIWLSASVPASLTVEGSRVHVMSRQASAIKFTTTAPIGASTFAAIGNRIDQAGNPDSGSGIDVHVSGGGSVRADIMNNSVWDVAACFCGSTAGLSIYPRDTVEADVNVVGNTFELSATYGINVRNDLDAAGALGLDAFDNVVAHAAIAGIDLGSQEPSTLTYRGGYNDSFANGSANELEGHSPGPGNLAVNPRFVDRSIGDLRLRPTSPLIDRGKVCSLGGVAGPDAGGLHRLAGASVDMGAHEFGATAPTGVVRVGTAAGEVLAGTAGADILCGLGGPDELRGKRGPDHLDGGGGPDIVIGGTGPDLLFGASGGDELCSRDGTGGNDRLDGGPGNDGGDSDPTDVRVSIERPGTCP